MSDSDDDYMSDKFVDSSSNTLDDIRPGLLFNRTTKRQHEIYKQKEVLQAKKPKTTKQIEEELREIGLNTAITTDNKGYQLLEKMGFKPGQSLGKTGDTGIKEPIKVEIRPNKSGVGRDTQIKEKVVNKQQSKDNNYKSCMKDFKNAVKERNIIRLLIRDIMNGRSTCEELDTVNKIEEPTNEFFWTKLTMRQRSGIDEENDDEVIEFNQRWEKSITEENLNDLIDYLRNRYFYCMYCGFVAKNLEDLLNSCPGPYRRDHDED